MASKSSRVLTDRDEIRQWAEERNASPACVRRTGGDGDVGMIRLDFPGYSGEQSLEHIDWDEWFNKFDESNLALLVQDELASGGRSNFNKLVGRETAQRRAQGDNRASRHKGGSSSGSSSRASSSRARSVSSRSSAGAGSRRSASAGTPSSRSSSARAKRAGASSSSRNRSARTTRASSTRTKSSGASSRGRTPGGTVSRSKSQRGSQRASSDVTRRSGTGDRGRASAGSRQAAARNTGRASAKRNPEKIVKSARKIKQDADNIIRMERGSGSRPPSRATKQVSAKSASGTARQSRSRNDARSRRAA